MMKRQSLLMFCGGLLLLGCAGDQVSNDEPTIMEASTEILVGSSRLGPTVHAICINGTAFTGAFSTALNAAIGSYNALALSIHFFRTTGGTAGCDAVITATVPSGFATVSGFPSGGRPFSGLGLGSGFAAFNDNVLRHAITHLLGHDIGLVHTDLGPVTPVSCAPDQVVVPNFGGSGQGGSGVGVVIPPGTPPPTPGGSIMNTCIPVTTNGQFTTGDIAGLRALF